ncbi:MAG: GTPase domain-containing protein [Candidatus Heimdallarchaeota archaeon]|nr:GTPase domain-containing protein [Candidatus Heimdallarchaeota archaeon]
MKANKQYTNLVVPDKRFKFILIFENSIFYLLLIIFIIGLQQVYMSSTVKFCYSRSDLQMVQTYQIIILGPGGVGKTKGTHALMSILNSMGYRTSDIKPWSEDMVVTSNFVIHNFIIPSSAEWTGVNEDLKVVLYDMGGQFKYKEMWLSLAEDTDGIICVCDMTRKSTLKQIPLMLPYRMMEGVPIRLIVNKADLYVEFSNKARAVAQEIHRLFQEVLLTGFVNYSVTYRGKGIFHYNNRNYKYGDTIHIFRRLEKDKFGDLSIRLCDFEVIAGLAFKTVMPDITEHNANLFGREFMIQMFPLVSKMIMNQSVGLTDSLLIEAHAEAPPFIAWGQDPSAFIPKLNKISLELILDGVQNMLIEDQDLLSMIDFLKKEGHNMNNADQDVFAMTSSYIDQEIPDLSYKPINLAMLTPPYIQDLIVYSYNKVSESDFFI